MVASPHTSRSTQELFDSYARSRDDRLRTAIIERHENLIRSLAHKFVRPGVPLEDLVQSAWIGLIGAVDRFDPAHGTQFITYAVQCAVGEIKRYFRDKTWAVKVPRHLQELSTHLAPTEERLSRTLQRAPTIAEMAEALAVSEEELLRAMDLSTAHNPVGLDSAQAGAEGDESRPLSETAGTRDDRLERVVECSDIDAALRNLDERERRILHLRFNLESTQQQVAEELGVSQMHVSRLERKALTRLRAVMGAA